MATKIYRKSLLFEAFKEAIKSMADDGFIKTSEIEGLFKVFDESIDETFAALNKREKDAESIEQNDGYDVAIEEDEGNNRLAVQGELVSFKNLYDVWKIKLNNTLLLKNNKVVSDADESFIFAIEE